MRDTVHLPARRLRPYHALLALVVVFAAGAIGSTATLPSIPTWYHAIAKPWFTPPDAVFGPAWTTLYLLMATAFYRVLGTPHERIGRTLAIGVFFLHMTLNVLWSVAFFGLRSPGLGVAELVLFWPVAIGNAVAFWRVDRPAGLLMLPNVVWVSFAAILTIAIWRMN